jgi:hypothetical protein
MVAPVATRSTATAGKSGRPAPASQAACCALSARRCCPSGAAHAGQIVSTEAACCKIDARRFRIYKGTTQIQQIVIANGMTKEVAG